MMLDHTHGCKSDSISLSLHVRIYVLSLILSAAGERVSSEHADVHAEALAGKALKVQKDVLWGSMYRDGPQAGM